jgi:AcrR family transcriptional regulator
MSMPQRSAKNAKPRTKAEQRAETLERILDAAEYLFSKHGLNGVTLRDVAQRVGVHTSLMHYYFVDKRRLFEAVFARRAGITSSRRLDALDRYEREAGDSPTVEGALRAFLDTDLDLYIGGGEGWRNFAAFAAQVSNSAEGAAMMDLHFDPVVLKLIGVLRKALPGCSDADIFWGYDFVTGALMHVLGRTGRIDRLSDGACKSEDFEAVKERLASFMAAGFLAICARPQKRHAPGKKTAR